jgi:maltose O-acetyltransferase
LNYLFEKALAGVFYLFRYRFYTKNYKLDPSFRFNGYFIKLFGSGEIIVGKQSYISFFSHIYSEAGTKVVIGDNVSIGHNVRIYSSSIDSELFVTEGVKGKVTGNVSIGNNVLIGTNVFINPGVSIGNNVIVGANSVVTKDIKPFQIVGGVPAKVLKKFRCDETK